MEAYRGIEDLIRALPSVKKAHPGIKLAVAGGARPATMRYLAGLKRLAVNLAVSSDIVWLGNLPAEELSWCYANCSAFVVTSRVESFCFVAVEALAQGCNIISTDSSCLPEVLGDAALYYKAGEPQGLAGRLLESLSRSPQKKEEISELAFRKAADFSWDAAAARTLEVLKKTVTRPGWS